MKRLYPPRHLPLARAITSTKRAREERHHLLHILSSHAQNSIICAQPKSEEQRAKTPTTKLHPLQTQLPMSQDFIRFYISFALSQNSFKVQDLFLRSSTLEDGLSPEKTMLNVCPYTTYWWVRFELVPLASKLVV
ncbi:hypothetical protein L3X38_015847 [Prunus dulcis]|uniref:Uncharacterized protein n=1 Tax=Prunus dulcis TaxID=3755 RepID=A0AAD4Z8M2_PRUDU|nr:hypothetical protein L3X38_015847 [Prunus dulcis]